MLRLALPGKDEPEIVHEFSLDLFTDRAGEQLVAEKLVSYQPHERGKRHEVLHLLSRRIGDKKQEINRLAVYRVVLDSGARNAECDLDFVQIVCLAVGDSHSVADSGALEQLSRKNGPLEIFPLGDGIEYLHAADELVKRFRFGGALEVGENGSVFEEVEVAVKFHGQLILPIAGSVNTGRPLRDTLRVGLSLLKVSVIMLK